mmetsp:Transcript_36525/g.96204  ORF Transcript_36525/g.96204 Transcript_36525/m.96204 type:complete len:216 (+) Transcript_36525:680-1327(+)
MVKTFLEDDLGRPRIVIEQHLLGTLFVDLVLDARVPMVEMVLIRPLIPQLAYLFMLDPSGVHSGIDSGRPLFAAVTSSIQMPSAGFNALIIDLDEFAFKIPVSTLVGSSLGSSCSRRGINPNFHFMAMVVRLLRHVHRTAPIPSREQQIAEARAGIQGKIEDKAPRGLARSKPTSARRPQCSLSPHRSDRCSTSPSSGSSSESTGSASPSQTSWS